LRVGDDINEVRIEATKKAHSQFELAAIRIRNSAGTGAPFDPLVLYFALGELSFVLMEVTNLNQRWPEFQRSMNLAHYVIDDPRDILLKKIRLEPIE
jgi:hypothetical protein